MEEVEKEKPAERIERLKKIVSVYPKTPGVYLMKNARDKIIYVGKAKNLKNRVRSYFSKSADKSVKTKYLVSHIAKIDYMLTNTEVEAFLLEASLIKKYRPRYNIRLKDDKSYPYIRCSLEDNFPRFYLARRVRSMKSLYFGPFTSSYTVRATIEYLNEKYKIRDCTNTYMKSRKRPCLTYQINRCKAPCVDKVQAEEYGEDVKEAIKFLKKEKKTVLKEMKTEMLDASGLERFELAAKLRDQLKSLKSIWERQVVVHHKKTIDQDVIAVFGDERGTLFETLHVRGGQLIGQRSFFLKNLKIHEEGEDPKEWFTSFLSQYYVDNIIPDEIIFPYELGADITKLLKDLFIERGKANVAITHAFQGDKKKLFEMAMTNAVSHFKKTVSKVESLSESLKTIQAKLHLPKLPYRIECYDISHFQGTEVVASQVVFEGGVENKDEYRRYKLTTEQNDDFANMKEVLERRFNHTEYDDPDLILIDGGKGQLNICAKVLEDIGRSDVPITSIAKARTDTGFKKKKVTSTEERFFIPGRANPVTFRKGSEPFKILVQLRDEAHRFAVSYHRLLRDKRILTSELDHLKGVGNKRKKVLLSYFGSLDKIKQASAKTLAEAPGISIALAKQICEQLKEG